MATMRAAMCRQAGTVVLEEMARPEPGPGDVVVRVRNCGICGSDLHWYHGQMMIPTVCPGHAAESGPHGYQPVWCRSAAATPTSMPRTR